MTRLLLDEPPLQVIRGLAVRIGLNEALVAQQLHFLITSRESNGSTHGGHRWIYNTHKEWIDAYFPFWSAVTIGRVFDSLEKMGLIVSSQPEGPNRRKHYRIDYESKLLADPDESQPINLIGPTYQVDRLEDIKLIASNASSCEVAYTEMSPKMSSKKTTGVHAPTIESQSSGNSRSQQQKPTAEPSTLKAIPLAGLLCKPAPLQKPAVSPKAKRVPSPASERLVKSETLFCEAYRNEFGCPYLINYEKDRPGLKRILDNDTNLTPEEFATTVSTMWKASDPWWRNNITNIARLAGRWSDIAAKFLNRKPAYVSAALLTVPEGYKEGDPIF